MVRTNTLSIAAAAMFSMIVTGAANAQSDNGQRKGHADLNGFQENPTLSSPASGT